MLSRSPRNTLACADEAVLLTNGVDEAIHLVCETYLEPQDEVIIVTPTFSMYALYAEADRRARCARFRPTARCNFPTSRVRASDQAIARESSCLPRPIIQPAQL